MYLYPEGNIEQWDASWVFSSLNYSRNKKMLVKAPWPSPENFLKVNLLKELKMESILVDLIDCYSLKKPPNERNFLFLDIGPHKSICQESPNQA